MIYIGIFTLILLANFYLYHKFPNKKLEEHKTYDVCIVLGSPSAKDGTCSRMQKSRMDRAIALYKANKVAKLIVSGGSVKNTYSEAKTMMCYAQSQGVQLKDILLEEQAINSYENLLYSKKICTQYGFDSVVVVTSNFHVRRSTFFVNKFFDDFAMAGTKEKEKFKHYLSEYIRMWNTLRIELQKKCRK